jgi:NitT/TauT family transport system substrate-binding protein
MPIKSFHLVRNLGLGALALLLVGFRPALADDALALVLGGQTPELMNTLNLTAEGAGFYKQERLKVSLTLVKGSLEARQTCSSGQFDICPIGIEPLITDYNKGIRLKMFLSRAAKFTYVYGVLEDSPIKSLTDFKGKVIGVHSSDGSTAQGATESGLTVAGLKSSDYKLVTIGRDDDAMGALVSGKVDGAALPYYEFIPYIIAGRKLRFFPHPALADVTNSGYAISPAVMAAKSDQVKRFSRAIVKSALLIRYNPQAAARAILVALGKPYNDADLKRKTAELNAWEAYLPAGDPTGDRIGAINKAGVQTYMDLMKSAGVISDTVPVSEIVTDQFVGPANDFDHAAFEAYAKSLH